MVKSPVVGTPHGTATFKISSKIYGICGETDSPLATGVNVSTSDFVDVNTTSGGVQGTKAIMNMVGDGPVFDKTLSTTSRPGAFAIRTGSFNSSQYGT